MGLRATVETTAMPMLALATPPTNTMPSGSVHCLRVEPPSASVMAIALMAKPESESTLLMPSTRNHTIGELTSCDGSTLKRMASSSALTAKAARLKTSFTGLCRRIWLSPTAAPTTRATTSSSGVTRNRPTTMGISLSE